MGKTKQLSAAFIAIFLVTFVYAQDYALFSGKFYELKEGEEKIQFEFYNGTYSICENEKKTIPILVVNKDTSTDSKYYLNAAGAEWVSLNVKEFLLPKKQSGIVFSGLSPGQNTEGRHGIKISSVSSANVRKDLSLDVNVEKCYSLGIALEKEKDKACGGEKKKYWGEVSNDGKQKSDVELGINGPNWINANKNAFSIDANDKQKFELNADIPANAKGVFNVAVSAAMTKPASVKSEKNLEMEVVPKYDCYKADIISDAKIANYYSNAYAQIKIRNSGAKQAEYEIGLEAPNWISIEPKKLSAKPGQVGNLNLNINPGNDAAEGVYAIKVNAKFDDIAYTKNIDVVLSKSQFLKGLKPFFAFYQYYAYVILFIAILLFIFRRQILDKIRVSYKNYKIRQARLRALEKARKAKQEKRQLKKSKEAKKAGLEIKKPDKYRAKWLFIAGLIAVIAILSLSAYQFDFSFLKSFAKNYYLYFIAGILISVFIIFLIEFYKPLFRLLKSIDRPKKKK